MSEMVRALVKQRLTAAAEEIFGLFERTITEHEEERCRLKEEIDRQKKLLDAVLKPEIRLHRADVHQLLVVKEEEPPEPPHIKEEDDEEKAQSSQLHQTQTEHMEPAADGEDCGGPEPARNSHPDPHLRPETEDQPEDSSETEDREDYSKETRGPQSGLKALKNKVSESDKRRKTGQKRFICSFCGKVFPYNQSLKSHMMIHTEEKTSSCSVCSKTFTRKETLKRHMLAHTGKKPFSCSVCSITFLWKSSLTTHMVVHTGEKRFSCKVCEQRFKYNKSLKRHKAVCPQSSQLHQNQTEENREAEPGASSSTEHMEPAADGEDCGGPEPARNSHPDPHLQPESDDSVDSDFWTPLDHTSVLNSPSNDESKLHQRKSKPMELLWKSNPEKSTREKTFSCSVCLNTFTRKETLKRHMVVHTGERPFSCSVCHKTFSLKATLKKHMVLHTGEKLFSCKVCEQRFMWYSSLRRHMAVCLQSSQLHQNQTEENREAEPGASSSTEQLNLQMKEEPEELWSSQEGEQLQHITKFPFTPVSVKSEDDEEKPQSSQLHQTQTEHMEPAADGEDCGGPEPARNSHPDPHLQPETEDQPEDSSETEDRGEYSKETRGPQSGLKALKNKMSESEKRRKTGHKQFICSFCGKRFPYNQSLNRHIRIHTGEKPSSCSVCSKTFTRKETLKRHMVVHTGERPFSCSVCSKTFTQKGNFINHMVLHTRFSCKVCEKRFMFYSSLRRHKAVCLQSSQLHQNQTEENREAEPGASSSTEQLNLQMKEEPEELWSSQEGEQLQHITKFPFTPVPVKSEDDEEKAQSSQLHQNQTEENREAEPGASSSTEQLNLSESDKRRKTGQKRFICSFCGKRFSRNQRLERHMRTHTGESDKRRKTGEKPQSCSDCGKRFSCNLKRHMITHTGEKPFSCSVCHKTFKRKEHLTHHMVVHTRDTPFSCSVCSKTFSVKGSLMRHMFVHTGKKPFSCPLCSTTCLWKSHLTVHMLIHTGEKPFNCSVCSRAFSVKSSLKDHMVLHTGEKRFSCKVCEKRFMWNSSLRNHEAACTKSSQPHQNQTEENREAEPGASSSTEQLNLQMKEEPEELWSSQEGEQLQHISKFPFTPVPVKSEDDEEKAQSSQLHQTQT